MSYTDINPTNPEHAPEHGTLSIVRLSPFINGIEAECHGLTEEDKFCKVLVTEWETGDVVHDKILVAQPVLYGTKLVPGIDYIIRIFSYDADGNMRNSSPARIFKCGYFPGKVVDYIHPKDNTFVHAHNGGHNCGSPYIMKLESTDHLLVSHDVFCNPGDGDNRISRFFESTDGGQNWTYLSYVDGCVWGTLFMHNDRLYLLSSSQESSRADLRLFVSDDCARTWSDPIVIAAKGDDEWGYRASPTPYVSYQGRLWFPLDRGGKWGICTASVALDADLTDPKNWTISACTAFDERWPGMRKPFKAAMEEVNMVISPDNKLCMLVRYNSQNFRISPNLLYRDQACILRFSINSDDPTAAPIYSNKVPFNMCHHKFYIMPDPVTDGYLCLQNRMISMPGQRNVLSLSYSKDLDHWNFVRDLINLHDMEWAEGYGAALQYPSGFLDGDTVYAVCRTAMNGAYNFHNNNAVTFHRFYNAHDRFVYGDEFSDGRAIDDVQGVARRKENEPPQFTEWPVYFA